MSHIESSAPKFVFQRKLKKMYTLDERLKYRFIIQKLFTTDYASPNTNAGVKEKVNSNHIGYVWS